MAQVGKISTIKKEYNSSAIQTMQSGLAAKGLTRIPGTGVFKYPYKETSGLYRTGLDPNAAYIKRIQDPDARKLEQERVEKLRIKLEAALSLDLSPRSEYWNSSKSKGPDDTTHVNPVKLFDGDNLFDFSNPMRELEFAWLRVNPTIASSYQAWERGEYPADTQWYVVDDEIETKIAFDKKRKINKAIIEFDAMSPSKKKAVARLMGIPVNEDTLEEVVYNQVDNLFKQSEFKSGNFQGLNPVDIFNRFSTMKENILHVKDIIEQAIAHSIYRVQPSGAIREGQNEIAKDKEELLKFLVDDENQSALIILEQKLKTKKLAAV